jgi:hypothetical protein
VVGAKNSTQSLFPIAQKKSRERLDLAANIFV